MNKTVDIIRDGKDVVVIANGKEVFRKPKTTQTVAIAHDIYMGYKYENGRWNNGSMEGEFDLNGKEVFGLTVW